MFVGRWMLGDGCIEIYFERYVSVDVCREMCVEIWMSEDVCFAGR